MYHTCGRNFNEKKIHERKKAESKTKREGIIQYKFDYGAFHRREGKKIRRADREMGAFRDFH